ncbi:MAG: hypothetical protein M1486_00750 [Gammaproteobacteria bacterium]|nr:hypothetical protein [Gammaproteobacteria bacterium]
MNRNEDHPEIENIKNICDISPDTKETKDVCEKVNKENPNTKGNANDAKLKNNISSEDPVNQNISKNTNPQ